MQRPLTAIYTENADYSTLSEVEFVNDDDADRVFLGIVNGLSLTGILAVVLLAGIHIGLSIAAWISGGAI